MQVYLKQHLEDRADREAIQGATHQELLGGRRIFIIKQSVERIQRIEKELTLRKIEIDHRTENSKIESLRKWVALRL